MLPLPMVTEAMDTTQLMVASFSLLSLCFSEEANNHQAPGELE